MTKIAPALAALLLAAGCSTGGAGAPTTSSTPRTTLTVLAAASLKEGFGEIETAYEAAHPDVDVVYSFGGSSTLAQQIAQGAPADVFAAASEQTMATVVDAHRAGSPTTFARNTMEIVTPPGNPGHVTSLADLQRKGLTVVLCQPAVPCGAASTRIFARDGLAVTPVSQEADVKGVLTKVQLGEADAGIVYVTDATAAGNAVHAITIPAAQNVTTSYPIAVLTDSRQGATATSFVAFVTGAQGQRILAGKGFARP